ncbi:MAG: hypothetical protein DHS20C14_01270 [Phycisphaeraceae bacterium]|nr:MAG: hypothetical protein DHS20C14_01270 [Phycisphaeraceae bacterium]
MRMRDTDRGSDLEGGGSSTLEVIGSVAFGTLRLRPGAPEWGAENVTGRGGPIVGVPRRAMRFAWAGSPREVVGTPAVALFSNQEQAYRKRALDPRGEATDWVWARPDVTAEFVARGSGSGSVDQSRPFGFMTGPVTPTTGVHLRALAALAGADPDPVLAEELALGVLGGLIAPAVAMTRTARVRREQTARAHHEAVNLAAEHMAAHATERMTLTDVARVAYLSPLHFCRIFRTRTGVTVHTYLTRLRLAQAVGMLADDSLVIAEIASRCGFAGGNHFADACRKHVGMTPSAVRRLTRGDRGELARALRPSPGGCAGSR